MLLQSVSVLPAIQLSKKEIIYPIRPGQPSIGLGLNMAVALASFGESSPLQTVAMVLQSGHCDMLWNLWAHFPNMGKVGDFLYATYCIDYINSLSSTIVEDLLLVNWVNSFIFSHWECSCDVLFNIFTVHEIIISQDLFCKKKSVLNICFVYILACINLMLPYISTQVPRCRHEQHSKSGVSLFSWNVFICLLWILCCSFPKELTELTYIGLKIKQNQINPDNIWSYSNQQRDPKLN